jgi:hypothetical protein
VLATIRRVKALPADEFLDEIENFHKKYYAVSPEFPEVDAKSNL